MPTGDQDHRHLRMHGHGRANMFRRRADRRGRSVRRRCNVRSRAFAILFGAIGGCRICGGLGGVAFVCTVPRRPTC